MSASIRLSRVFVAGCLVAGCHGISYSALPCDSDDDCPGSFECGASGKCVPFTSDASLSISSVTTPLGTVFSAVQGYDQVEVTFNSSKSLDASVDTLAVSLDQSSTNPFQCSVFQETAPNYKCTYQVTATDHEGPHDITIHAVDAADGAAVVPAVTITFVLTSPSLTATLSGGVSTSDGGIGNESVIFGTQPPDDTVMVSVVSVGSSDLSGAPVTVAATIGAHPMVCTPLQTMNPNFLCTYTVTAGGVSGAESITVTSVDEVGNAATPVVISMVTIDPTVPVIDSATILMRAQPPSVLQAAPSNYFSSRDSYNTITVRVDTSTDSAGMPFVVNATLGNNAFACAALSTPLSGPGEFECTYNVTGNEGAGPGNVTVTVEDIAGNASAPTQLPVILDFTPPMISNAATDKQAYSTVTGYNTVNLTFVAAVSTALSAYSSSAAATITPQGAGSSSAVDMICGANSEVPNGFTCAYAVTGSEESGNQEVTLTLMDPLGNPATQQLSMAFYFTPPVISAVYLNGTQTIYSAQPSYDQVSVTAQVANGDPAGIASVTASFDATTEPCSSEGETGSGPRYTCGYTVTGAEAGSSLNITVTVVDNVGYTASMGTTAAIDFTPPVIVSATPGKSSYMVGETMTLVVIAANGSASDGSESLM